MHVHLFINFIFFNGEGIKKIKKEICSTLKELQMLTIKYSVDYV